MALMDVLLDELRDLYSAENQLVKALPKLVKGANDPAVKSLIANHLEETKQQVLRLRQAFEILGKKPTGQHCNGMEGLIEEGQDALEKDEEGANFDLGICGASARVEHYEIAGYTTSISLAKSLGLTDVVALLQENLAEEVAAAKAIFAGAKPLLKAALTEGDPTENEEEKKPKSAKEKASERKSKQDEKQASTSVSKKR
ncbi:MAG: ferritin-like domain-containing protein [Terriglobus sp.]